MTMQLKEELWIKFIRDKHLPNNDVIRLFTALDERDQEVKDYDTKVVELLDKIHDLTADNYMLSAEVDSLKQERFEFGKQTVQNFMSIGEMFIEEKKETERLRKALEEIAEEDGWEGWKARQALAGEEEG